MATILNTIPDPVGAGKDPDRDPASDSNLTTTLFHRRVEFHAARKPFSGFSEGGNSGFKLVTLNPNSSSGSKSDSKKACFGSRKASELALEHGTNGMDPELSFTITFRRIGAGLQNLGNTCFLNSVLQCLTYTEPLAAYLQSGRHQNSCHMAGFCALCAIQKHVSRALESTGRILAPKYLVSNLRCISRSFRNARQEDAHEYMVNLLESMHKCCLPSGMPSESPSAYEKSLVHKIFGGRLCSQVKCMQCSFCSNKFDPFLDLSLEIAKADSLKKALAQFTAREQLDGGERQYQCQQCKQKVRALKQLTIYKAPEVLSIHLKRFGSHNPSQKIDRKIQFDSKLDLEPFVTGPYDGGLKYTLYGVLVHAGWSTHSGHYYCFVRTSSGMWYSLDDNQVVQVSERRVLEQKAYMLFYVRDRTFSLSKKMADTIHKESTALNSSGGQVLSNHSQALKENISNGNLDKKLNDSLSAEASQKLALNPLMSKEIQMKVDSHLNGNGSVAKLNSYLAGNAPIDKMDPHQNSNDAIAKVGSHHDGNGPAAPKCSSPCKEHPIENSVKVSPASGLGNGFPISSSNVRDLEMQTLFSSLKGSGSTDFLISTNGGSSTSNGLKVPVTVEHDCDGLHSSACKNESASVLPPNADNIRSGVIEDLSNTVDGPSNSNVLQGCPQDASTPEVNRSEKVGGCSKNSGVAYSSVQKVVSIEDGPRVPRTPKDLLCERALDDSIQTLKVKPLKHFVITHKLSKGIILGAAFGRRKKRHRIEHYFSTKVNGSGFKSDLGRGTSEKPKVYRGGHSQKRMKCGSDEKDRFPGEKKLAENCDLPKSSKDITCKDGNGQYGKSITRYTQLSMGSVTLDGKTSDTGKSGSSEHNKRDLVENGMMSILTRGIEETTVARWDGVEHPSGFVESKTDESLRIGYIGDEWDEAYDYGKRKKIRTSKNMFDGSNPFQEIATEKAKGKSRKLDQYSSANQPFRIL